MRLITAIIALIDVAFIFSVSLSAQTLPAAETTNAANSKPLIANIENAETAITPKLVIAQSKKAQTALAPSLTADANEAGIASLAPIKEQTAIKAGADAKAPTQQNAVTITNANVPTSNPVIITGETYPFAEQDLLEQIQRHIETNKEAIEARLKEQQSKALKRIVSYKPKDLTSHLPRATKDRTFYPDLTYVVQEDIKDARGTVIYPKGYRYNPIDYVWLKTSYIVIDAKDRDQLEWLKKSEYTGKLQYQIWLSNGNWKETSGELKIIAPSIHAAIRRAQTPTSQRRRARNPPETSRDHLPHPAGRQNRLKTTKKHDNYYL